MKNPNRVRSLYASFAMNNPVCFHDESGAGYVFLADAVIELNQINPQIASRLLTPMREWRRYTADRQDKMKAELKRIAELPDLSPDVFEVVSKINQDGTTVLMVEQNAGVLGIADRAFVMEKGTLVYEGEGGEILDHSEIREAYLGAPA